jgi:hypothetical protein
VSTPGVFAVVVIADEPQAGQVDGTVAGSLEADRPPMSPRESNAIGLSVALPHDFACGHLHLRGDGDLVAARHTRRAALSELQRTQTSQYRELERGELRRTLHHGERSFRVQRVIRCSANDE